MIDRYGFNNIGDYILFKCDEGGDRPFIKSMNSSEFQTYNEFKGKVLQAAAYLSKSGLNPGDRFILQINNDIVSLAMFMGGLVVGAIPVVVSPGSRNEELGHYRELSSARAVCLSAGSTVTGLSNLGVITFTTAELETAEPTSDPIVLPSRIDETAYLIFTSGSSGAPKMVAISHRNMLAEINSMSEAYGFDSLDRHLCILPVCHASALYRNVLLPFHTGGFVVLAKDFDFHSFWAIIEKERITFVQVVPSVLRHLLSIHGKSDDRRCLSLKNIGSASAPHPVELVRSFEETFGVSVLQGYGLTEATCGITLNPLDKTSRKPGSPGQPLPGNRLEIWDENDQPLAMGQDGRVMVRGDNIAQSGGRIVGDGWLDTGDVGHLDEDGFLWLTSRESEFIKRAGYRISPNEVEDTIFACFPGVEAVVTGIPHPLLGQDIVAFIVRNSEPIKGREIIRALKGRLSSNKIPSRIVFVERIPMIGVGKPDKKKLIAEYLDPKSDGNG